MKPEPEKHKWIYKVDSVCWVCRRGSDQVHHIARKGFINSVKKYDDPAIFFLICTICHAGDFHNTSRAWQLALKLKYDPERFDLDRYNELCDPTLRVTQAEVEAEINKLNGRKP